MTDNNISPWRFCTAPCMDWSDRHCRYFWRQLTQHARLYTEMVTTGALLHGDVERHLRFDTAEHPIALQLGGSSPADLASSAKLGESWGYDEINLNCGCPSDRVQNGRIGIDHQETYTLLRDFVGTVAEGGCEVFIIHARKAWLSGLSPKENREIPPLNYPWVYQLKRDFPALTIVLNGGITDLIQCDTHLKHVDGVMLGRAAYQNPWLLSRVDSVLFDALDSSSRRDDIINNLHDYVEQALRDGSRLNHISRHVLGLYQGEFGGRAFRRHLSENAHTDNANFDTLKDAMALTRRETSTAN